ncbi:hypothetical protein H6M51_16375 [Rhizobium sp. AQ_MP]|uniref:hypothetical protein n=1 Tax=Rhizobium sp. AQ_MP TaxID=2761536 RepID=UPI00163B118E|nr:hypothetical protein [Rhizobium sp. AQ_MP]MBC2774443.1 hypothetical protein [Rhizobium sp. AQ_MP]
MTEAGHEDRTILDVLAPLYVVQDDPETPRLPATKGRSAVQGAIIGQLLPRFAEDEAPAPLDFETPHAFLSRAYLDV